ncbi:MAG: phosphohistidine phosphatase SixA [Thermoplasmatota archaeon]
MGCGKIRLYLVQHGKSASKEEDPERPLTDEGTRDVKRISDLVIREIGIDPAVIYHSGKKRAKITAEIIARDLNAGGKIAEGEGLDPLDPIIPWAGRIEKEDRNMMIVGHLPFLSRLASHLLIGLQEKPIVNFKMGCMICMERDESEKWVLDWMIIP